MPDCLTKTLESLRKHKLEHWDRNRESNRAWLALNMMTEAQRRLPRLPLRRQAAARGGLRPAASAAGGGARWSEELMEEIAPWTGQPVGGGARK